MRKTFAFSILALALLLVSPAFADTCISFATYDCASHVTNNVHIVGQAGTGLPVGTTQGLITGSSFTVQMTGNRSALDIVLIAASPLPLTGTLNGISFTSLSSFPEGGAINAINNTLTGLGYQLWVRGSGYSSGREHHSNGERLWLGAWNSDLRSGLEQRLHR